MTMDRMVTRLCLVTDRRFCAGRGLGEVVARAVRGGVTMVQLREKGTSTRQFLEEALALKVTLAGLGVPLLINDRVDIALAIDADGVHVGQQDMPLGLVREMIGPDKLIGLSITNAQQLQRDDAERADYLGIGPIYSQSTKEDASTPLGVEGFRQLRAMTQRPVLAIGGLKPENSAAVAQAGADGLAIVSAIMGASDPEASARSFRGLYR